MLKKISIGISITGLLIILGIVFAIAYINFQLTDLEKRTYAYLTEQKNYEKSDILTVKARLKKLSRWTAEVVFADEPQVTYDYKLVKGEGLIQIGASDPDIDNWKEYQHKHLE
ncbi:hypothetical protein J40TS1_50680 [Paenibacillus montaniterrae]|uniref:DUF3139 domain-containing protein n=1 Tax=Paenibacillus montaniterrae TaxID=429341 RepID=A0A919YVR7_9BACL|nr:DUF3139 domain-containing protein [Paenibacillus montaniterrae]GIP19426.1 hypothetical protein J40TS1_50680 [Paenibacillus montaniterrae]